MCKFSKNSYQKSNNSIYARMCYGHMERVTHMCDQYSLLHKLLPTMGAVSHCYEIK